VGGFGRSWAVRGPDRVLAVPGLLEPRIRPELWGVLERPERLSGQENELKK